MTVRRLLGSFKKRGLFGTAKRLCLYPWGLLRWHLDAGFDRSHHVDTSGRIPLESLQIKSNNLSDATWYEPVPSLVFKRLMKELRIQHKRYIFIDFGSGKGRALFLASDFPFQKAIGIEFSPILHAACQRNIESYRSRRQRCHDIVSVNCDVVDFEMPPVPSVFFFYSPFKASVFSMVLDNLRKSLRTHPRSIYLLFIGFFPEGIEVLKASEFKCREIVMGLDYIRWEKKRGLILHSGVADADTESRTASDHPR